MNYIVIDQGTSSTKAFLFNDIGKVIYSNKIKHNLSHPKKFHVEFDAVIILDACKSLFQEMVQKSGETPVRRAGLSVQRSTFLLWEKESCHPVTPALSWQDSRAFSITDELLEHSEALWKITGTPLSAHFGGPKFLHLIRQDNLLQQRVKNNQLYFGSLSAYLLQSLTGTAGIDESIACRTLLYNIHKSNWSSFALDLFRINENCLPPILPVKNNHGKVLETHIPLSVVIGDQQGSLIGQAGLEQDSIATNFGTSASVQFNVGNIPNVVPRLISSVLFSDENKKYFMAEGTINACNSLFYHLENELNIPHEKMKWDQRASQITTNGIFIPGFSGLSAPYWTKGFEDIYIDLNKNYNKNEIIRAGMESIGFLVNDILDCLTSHISNKSELLTAAGGGAREPLLQFIADISGIPVGRSAVTDSTAFGVYRLLNPEYEHNSLEITNKIFNPNQKEQHLVKKGQWKKAINQFIK